MNGARVYEMSSIVRPLDPGYLTNRIVMAAMPAAAIVYLAVAAWRTGVNVPSIVGAVASAVAALLGWALVRELAPDEDAIAFVGLAAAVAAHAVVGAPSVLVGFTALFLIRIVNRTVGLPARISDSIGACGLVAVAVWATGFTGLGLVAASAFFLDAVLDPTLRRQWIFCVVSAAGTAAAYSMTGFRIGLPQAPTVVDWLLAGTLILFVIRNARTSTPQSKGDATGQPLSLPRIRGGMGLAALICLLSLFAPGPGLPHSSLVWTSIGTLAPEALAMRSKIGARRNRRP